VNTLRGFAWALCSVVAIAAGCGGANNTPGFDVGDGGGSGDDATASSSGSGSGGSSSGSSSGLLGGDASSSSGSDGGHDAGGCTTGITCQGNTEHDCVNGHVTTTQCTAPQVCAAGFGCVACVPGTGSCSGSVGTACNATGTGTVTNTCDPLLGEMCDATTGTCTGDCAALGASYLGCEYYAVTMSNSALDQSTFYFSVSLSNTSTHTANISITGPNATNVTDTIPAGQLKEYHLGWVQPLSCNGTCDGLSNMPASTVQVAGGAYHIRSTEPLSAYQFNARDYEIGSVFSYTNDASLLIPVNALTGNYRVVSGATWQFSATGAQYPGNVDIVGTADGTQVTYTAPAGNTIQPGPGLTATGGTVTLNHGDVLQIAAAGDATAAAFGSDQTGAVISATKPVLVFGGTDCTYMPATVEACDHIEEINFPIETLRGDYLVTLPNNQNGSPQQYVKIVGTANGTTLTYDPQPAGAATTLSAGQVTFFQATQHFHVKASQPIIIGQFMESENNFTPTDTSGDPAMSTAVATAQFRNNYQFVAPANYMQNWVNIIAPTGATVKVDGTAVTGFAAIGTSSGYSVAYWPLCANNAAGCTGVHSATSTASFGIQVYGYGSYTSYMYPGGLNLNR